MLAVLATPEFTSRVRNVRMWRGIPSGWRSLRNFVFVNEFAPLDAVPAVTAAPTASGDCAAAPRRVRLKTAPRQDYKATRIPLEFASVDPLLFPGAVRYD